MTIRWTAILALAALTAGCDKERIIAHVQAKCGDERCDVGEDPFSCAVDCHPLTCGNHVCEFDEDEQSCPKDCDSIQCGDGLCMGDETARNCPQDCPWGICGNNVCEAEDVQQGCSMDCWPPHCGNGICDAVETVSTCPEDCLATEAVDILLVVDDSDSMLPYQERLSAGVPAMYERLVRTVGAHLDVHIGVVTTDLGAGEYVNIGGCQVVGGDLAEIGWAGGRDVGASCLGQGEHFFVDVAPRDCSVERFDDGSCGSNECTEENCAFESSTRLVIDEETGCPRCRNFVGSPAQALGCLVSVDASGCGLEQPLEAMRLALDGRNVGFLRDGSLLVLVFLSDEDDCSAADPATLYDPDPQRETGELGHLSSYRCTRFGLVCDQPLDEPGSKTGCMPNLSEDALLVPPDEYQAFLLERFDPGRLVVATIVGPESDLLHVDQQGDPVRLVLRASCYVEENSTGAVPAVRLRWFGRRFYVPGYDELDLSVCESAYESFGLRLASVIAKRLGREP